MKKWLIACDNRMNYDWKLKNEDAEAHVGLNLPEKVRERITRLNATMVKKNLAIYAKHLTSGPSEKTLVTCPEIGDIFFGGKGWKSPYASGVHNVELDEYLRYLIMGLSLAKAKNHMLFFFHANRYRFSKRTFK